MEMIAYYIKLYVAKNRVSPRNVVYGKPTAVFAQPVIPFSSSKLLKI